MLRHESIDVAVELYATLVPHLWSPTVDFYKFLVREIDAQSGHKHLPKVWTDVQSMNVCGVALEGRMEFYERFCAAMRSADLTISPDLNDIETEENRNLLKTFTLIGEEVYEDIIKFAEPKFARSFPLSRNLNAIPIFNHILDIAIRNAEGGEVADYNWVGKVIHFSRDQVTTLVGTLNADLLTRIVQTIVEVPLPMGREVALTCVYYAAENRLPEASEMVKLILVHFSSFDEVEKKQLNQLFAHDTEWTNLI